MREQSDERDWLLEERRLLANAKRHGEWNSYLIQALVVLGLAAAAGLFYFAYQVHWMTILKPVVKGLSN